MKAQTPAEGIMLTNDYGYAKVYLANCECSDPDHAHMIDISYDPDIGVAVEISLTIETPSWKMSKWKMIWQLLTKGYIKAEAAILMNEQQAVNYTNAITKCIKELSIKR